MVINITDYDAAHHRLGDALNAVAKARDILLGTHASDEVRESVIHAENRVCAARAIINAAITKQLRESSS